MKNISTQKKRIIQYIDYKGLSKNKFYIETGISNGVLDKSTGLTMETVEKFYSTYNDINPEWLITGKGEMLKNSENVRNLLNEPFVSYNTTKQESKGIPLIPVDAITGWSSGDVSVMKINFDDYHIPEFTSKADYLIRVTENSMSPTYNSGDIVACKRIPTKTFFQWGKVYVLDTVQGALCKRVNPSDKGEDYLCLESDNPNYRPFNLPKSEIRSLSLVVGLVRLE